MKTFKALSALLMYPTLELQQAIPAIREVLDSEQPVFGPLPELLTVLLHNLEQADLYTLQENYVLLFDRSRSLSLNLFEHVHGESRDRGGAMVDLLTMYRDAGFDLNATELPDHLPVLLEFLSTQHLEEAKAILNDAAAILVALSERLSRRDTPYAAVLQVLTRFAEARSDTEQAQALLEETMDDPEDLTALDAIWYEAEVTFGPGQQETAACMPVSSALAQGEHPIHIHRKQVVNEPKPGIS